MGDVLHIALKNLSVDGACVFETYKHLKASVERLYARVGQFESEVGYAEVQPLDFVPSGLHGG